MLNIRRIDVIGRTYRHIQRYREILRVLIKYGFGDLVDALNAENILELGMHMISRKREERIELMSRPERIRRALEELGPTFIKMGQLLSTRPDVLPMEFIHELAKLQDNVPPFSPQKAVEIVAHELGSPADVAFAEFEQNPFASASLGQVHRAVTKSGETVVVKVQRPDIHGDVEVDLEIILYLAGLAERHVEGWELQHPTAIVEEFAKALEDELDYMIEASYMEHFRWQFQNEAKVYVPRIFKELTTSRILTTEYIDGVKATDAEQLKKDGLDPLAIASTGFDLIMTQVFGHGFFHADPHPGNLFILPDNVICYVDFGMMGRVDRKNRDSLADLILGIARRNEQKTAVALTRLTKWEDEPDMRALRGDVLEFMDRNLYRPLDQIELEKLLYQSLEIARKHRLTIPPDLFLMVKALSTVEALGKRLSPDFNTVARAETVMRRIQLERYHPSRLASDLMETGNDFFMLAKEIPRDFQSLMRIIRKGDLTVTYEHKGLEPMLETHDRISNRLAFSLVLASLIIGSALMVLSGIPPKWQEIPIIGLAGFVVAGLMGFWLLVSIIRRGML